MLFISISQNSGHSKVGSSATQGRGGVYRAHREPARYNFCGQCWTLKLEPHHAPVDASLPQSEHWLWEKPSLLLSRERVIQLLYQTHKPTLVCSVTCRLKSTTPTGKNTVLTC